MKKYFLVAMASILLTINIGCSKKTDSPAPAPVTPPTAPAPTANFGYAGEGLAPSTVSFVNTSSNASSYIWDFGDNGTSTESNPTHTYRVGGVYTVKLTATGAGGSNSTTKTINITAPTKYTVTKVTLDSVPFLTSTGTTWDTGLEALGTGGAYPDIYFKITDSYNVDLWNKMAKATNNISASNLPFSATLSPVYQSSNLTQAIYISVMDYDLSSADTEIGYVGFSISSLTTGPNSYPTTVTQSRNGIKITLSLIWQ